MDRSPNCRAAKSLEVNFHELKWYSNNLTPSVVQSPVFIGALEFTHGATMSPLNGSKNKALRGTCPCQGFGICPFQEFILSSWLSIQNNYCVSRTHIILRILAMCEANTAKISNFIKFWSIIRLTKGWGSWLHAPFLFFLPVSLLLF